MTNSVLGTVKTMLGLPEEYESHFDQDLTIHINTVLMILSQMGVVKPQSKITDETTSWDEIITEGADLEGIKSYVYLKVKTLFDPPTSSPVVTAYDNAIKELEWRLYAFSDKEFMDRMS